MRPPVIIGGGPAGVAAALTLRRGGQPVILLERSAEPVDKPCGDFLGAAAIRMAESFGLSLQAAGARPITHLRLIRGGRTVESPLPFQAMALPRRVFDGALLRAAEAAGVQVVLGQAIPPPREEQGDFIIDTAELGRVVTGTVFMATGRPRGPIPVSPRPGPTAFKMYFKVRKTVSTDLSRIVEVSMVQGRQMAMQMVDRDTMVLCMLSRRDGGDCAWEDVLAQAVAAAPHLERRLSGATPLLDEPLIARNIPLGFIHRTRGADHDGLYRIGDQAALLSSLMADGVSVAMHGAIRAARTLLAGAGAGDYHRRLRAMLWPRLRLQADYVVGTSFDPPDDPQAGIEVSWNRLIA